MTPSLHRRPIVWAWAFLLGLAGGGLAACGGRSRTFIDVPDDPSAGAGSTQAGAPNGGGAGRASGGALGTAAGAPASGGSATAGDSGQCSTVTCELAICPPGTQLVTPPGYCCPICQSACAPDMGCTTIGCGPGSHSEMLPGNCCPVCVDDPPNSPSCADGKMNYAGLHSQLLYKYQAGGCTSDLECVALAPVNRCESGCSYAAVDFQFEQSFIDNLSSAADVDCANCELGPTPPCVPPPLAHCVSGECVLGAPD